jgi:hypothetical protein
VRRPPKDRGHRSCYFKIRADRAVGPCFMRMHVPLARSALCSSAPCTGSSFDLWLSRGEGSPGREWDQLPSA